MRTPTRAMPRAVERWASRARWLRVVDLAAAVVAAWPVLTLALAVPAGASAVVAPMLVGAAALVRPLRLRWRPVSALVSLAVSRALKAGDLAWCIFPGRGERVIVTARHGGRLIVARPGQGAVEGLEVRRTRVLVVPADRTG
jgi:hypothetical protein